MQTIEDLKELTDINLKTLEDALRRALTEQVGGDIFVSLTKFARPTDSTAEVEIAFRIYDHSREGRPVEREARGLRSGH